MCALMLCMASTDTMGILGVTAIGFSRYASYNVVNAMAMTMIVYQTAYLFGASIGGIAVQVCFNSLTCSRFTVNQFPNRVLLGCCN
jgi:hypothetical protein